MKHFFSILSSIYLLDFHCQIALAKVGFIPKCSGPVTIKDQISSFALHQNGRLAFSSSNSGENYFIDIKQSKIIRKANIDSAHSATFHPTKPILFWVSSIDSNMHKYNLIKNDPTNTINQNDLQTSKNQTNDVLLEGVEISGDFGVLPMNQDVLYGISTEGLFLFNWISKTLHEKPKFGDMAEIATGTQTGVVYGFESYKNNSPTSFLESVTFDIPKKSSGKSKTSIKSRDKILIGSNISAAEVIASCRYSKATVVGYQGKVFATNGDATLPGRLILKFTDEYASTKSISFTNDCKSVLIVSANESSGDNGSIHIVDIDSSRLIQTITLNRPFFGSFVEKDQSILSISQYGKVNIYEKNSEGSFRLSSKRGLDIPMGPSRTQDACY